MGQAIVPAKACPARTWSTDQAAKLGEEAKRSQVVESDEDHQCQQNREARSERPFLSFRLQRLTPHSLDRVEQQMPAIQLGDWQEVDESQIN